MVTFQRFLSDQWSKRVLSIYIDGEQWEVAGPSYSTELHHPRLPTPLTQLPSHTSLTLPLSTSPSHSDLTHTYLTQPLPLSPTPHPPPGMKKLSEAARLPCCDFPTEYAPKKGAGAVVDIRKCLWVADKVLMRRHTKTAYAFAASLAIKGEVITESELSM